MCLVFLSLAYSYLLILILLYIKLKGSLTNSIDITYEELPDFRLPYTVLE